MKKFITAILALTMLLSMSVTVFAAGGSAGGKGDGSSTIIDVEAKYIDEATTPDVVSVDIEWGAMQFTYSESGSHEWNAANHTYEIAITSDWSASGNTVTATNHSNVSIDVGFSFAANADSSVTGSFDIASDTLEAGVVDEYASADNVTTTLTLGGSVPSTQTSFTKVGTITVSIKKTV